MKKITLILAALVISFGLYAQNPEINSIGIAGRAVKGVNNFETTQMLIKVAEGEFAWIGYLYHNQFPGQSNSMGFKFKVNNTGQGNDWLNVGVYSLRAVSDHDHLEVSAGNSYDVDYSQQKDSYDYKWRLKQGEDDYYRITIFTSDVENVTMKLEKADADFADLVSLSVEIPLTAEVAALTPAFDPAITEYTCELMKGTLSVKPKVMAFTGTPVSGNEAVDVSNGSGKSNIVVTSVNGESTKTYTINYKYIENGSTDYTHLIINNNFDYAAEGILYNDSANGNYPGYSDGTKAFVNAAWRPVKSGLTTHLDFYGWQLSDWDFLYAGTSVSNSIGINAGTSTTNGPSAWISGHSSCVMPEDFEFYQVIDKENLQGGTYKLTCLMGLQSDYHTSQRLFANNNVRFYGLEENYKTNKLKGEIYSYAGHIPTPDADLHRDMKVYVTISDNDSLKIGVRSGGAIGDNRVGGTANLCGWFKMDDFRLVRIEDAVAADATLKDITLNSGNINFTPEITTYHVTLPEETQTVIPTVIPSMEDVTISGVEEIDVTSGEGTSTIIVTALNGTTTQTYNINYKVGDVGVKLDEVISEFTYFVKDSELTVKGADAYTVYDINGMTIAKVQANESKATISLTQGIYVVKTNDAKVFKVVVK